jgi:hypothetical protein
MSISIKARGGALRFQQVMCLLSSICLTIHCFTSLTRFLYAPLAGRCIREMLMEYFGDEKEPVEVSDIGCCER